MFFRKMQTEIEFDNILKELNETIDEISSLRRKCKDPSFKKYTQLIIRESNILNEKCDVLENNLDATRACHTALILR
jgi:hypothetical protein